jgi:hypothetical protein
MATTQPFHYYREETPYPLVEFLRQTNVGPETKPYHQNLRKVYLINKTDSSWSDGRFFIEMDLFGCWSLFDQLPSIESIGADIVEEDDNGKGTLDRPSNISRIAINHSHVASTTLVQLISSCRVLREFQYSIGGRASNDGGNPIVNPKAIIKSILGHKETLEILDLDVDGIVHLEGVAGDEDVYERMEDYFDQYGSPFETDEDPAVLKILRSIWVHGGSLKDFGSLKKLSLGFKFLLYFARGISASGTVEKSETPMLVDCLPDSLEYLCIRGYEKGENEEFDRQVDALMAHFTSGLSNLKEVKGIMETIPNSENVDNPDGDHDLLWSLEEAGYESD